ncbi:MAG: 2-isopropylmalate synthase, partial [Spirochaetales bacterium]|nr:2-isopropylmalate synthase [Spirochaetales bacterium]
IEAGFPISSPEDMEAVRIISAEVRKPVICGLSRARIEDIDACGKALEPAAKSRIHTGLGVSDIHIQGIFADIKYGSTLAEKRKTALSMSIRAVLHAKGFTDDVEYYAMDSARAEKGFLFELFDAVIEAGATVINIPDTTGYAVPEQFGRLIGEIYERTKGTGVVLSVHCHDDLGMAVANTLAGVRNGARQIESTMAGIGERAGNSALEEVVMALRTRKDYYNVDTAIATQELYKTSRMVADALSMNIPANKAIIGANAFSHSSGIHVDGVLKERQTFEIMEARDVGAPESSVVLTARTGRHGISHRLKELGYSIEGDDLEKIYERFLKVADKKQEVYDEDLIAIIHDEVHSFPSHYNLEYLHTTSGTGTIPTATVRLKIGDTTVQGSACGDGPVDATYRAIISLSELNINLSKYEIRGVTGGTEAMGEVLVRLELNGRTGAGRGVSTDIIEASARALVDGLNRLEAIKDIRLNE